VAASVYSRALRKAIEILGSRAKLARHLHVPESELQKWLADEARPPKSVFLAVVDLVIDETPAPADESHSVAPPDDAEDPARQGC
jgi:hypothetical protein